MEKLSDGRIVLTSDEARYIVDFIDQSLDTDWDRYTDNFICKDSWEDGKRQMNPKMYDFKEQLEFTLINQK